MKKIIFISVVAVLFSTTAFAQLPIVISARMSHYFEKDLPAGAPQNSAGEIRITLTQTDGYLHVQSSGDENISRVEIYNTSGSLVLSENTEGPRAVISAHTLAKGAYIIRVYLGQAVASGVICKS